MLKRLKLRLHPHQLAVAEMMFSVLVIAAISTAPAAAVSRFQFRSLQINQSTPGTASTYTLSMQFVKPGPIGSVDMLFCIDPIPTEPCVVPTGLDVSNAILSSQAGETGFTISARSANHLVLTRNPSVTTPNVQSTYVFDNIINPTYKIHSFSIRLADYTSQDASGPLLDLGSVVTTITDSIALESQVPPMLIFCVAQHVSLSCDSTDNVNYTDLGTVDPGSTLTTNSQMAVGTNASGGFAITINGSTMAAGTHVIAPLATPTASIPGINQFGVNLVANNDPQTGSDPDGDSTNAVSDPDYAIPNKYMYRDGDVVASSPNVSLIRRYTVSYIVNASPTLRAGNYTTTISYICSGRF